jgi:two-component system chemotaxis response regulator CheY
MPSAAAIKVLIVDDQQSMRLLVRGGLQQLGFREFEEAADGEAGLRLLMTSPVQLIISDFNMPKLDGLGLLRAVRVHPPISKTAYIMLTGRGDVELVQRAVQFGVNNFLVKPFTVATLREKIEAVFGALTP